MLPQTSQPPPDDAEVKRWVVKRLRKKQRDDAASIQTMEFPESLRGGDESTDEYMTAIPTQHNGLPMVVNMNQSIFGIIAAASSRLDCNDRFDDPSTDDESDDVGVEGGDNTQGEFKVTGMAETQILQKQSAQLSGSDSRRKRLSENRLLRSLPTLPRLSRSKYRKSKKDRQPQLQTPAEEATLEPTSPLPNSSAESSLPHKPITSVTPPTPLPEPFPSPNQIAPVMSRMLEARDELSYRPSFDLERLSGEQLRDAPDSEEDNGMSKLAARLMEIFEFDGPEEVIDEYPCWLLQSVLLQGFMYLTTRHVCFYAYLPKKAEVVKAGYLSKSGKHMAKYNRYWFSLKGDVLTYCADSANPYFRNGHIDLRYGISAGITDKDKDGIHFSVVTHNRTYHFRADSAPSAKEWVKSLQRVIFRSHNDGDSVKISLPIENIIDVEETQMIQFADTCKIRVVDNDETYAVDEYFFTFFASGKRVIDILQLLVDAPSKSGSGIDDKQMLEPPGKRDSYSSGRQSVTSAKIRPTKLPEVVKATLIPITANNGLSPRTSGEVSRTSFDALRHLGRRSVDVGNTANETASRRSFGGSGRRSLSSNRLGQRRRSDRHTLTDSYVQSLEDPSVSALMASSSEDPSASQILHGSEVFRGPTVQRSASVSRLGDVRESSQTQSTRQPSPACYMPRAATTGTIVEADADEQWNQQQQQQQPPSTPTLKNITRLGALPLQRAGALADYLNKTSRRMSSLIATESMGYVEKVSGMWKGSRKHYNDPTGLKQDETYEEESSEKRQLSNERFRAHFALPESEQLQATYFGHILRVLPLYGKIYISNSYFCFRSLLPGTKTKLILPFKDIENADKEKGFRFGYHGLVLVVRAHEELFFEFSSSSARDDLAIFVLQTLEKTRFLKESGRIDEDEKEDEENAMAERDALEENRRRQFPDHELKLPIPSRSEDGPTILYDDPDASFLVSKPPHPLRITCLTIGSRGDVQPYIALAKGLISDGHKVRIATHAEFKDWIEGHGIEFAKVDGDPGKLMQLCIENGTFTWAFYREASSTFRGWLDELLASAWAACQGSELLIESPSAMAGIHIAEALGIPYFRAFTMPWTRTRAYPHAFVMPSNKMGGAYNYMTYVMFDNVFWKATAHQINRWRSETLQLSHTTLEKMKPNQVPFLYNFSPFVVAPPLDYSDWIRVTGYWFLDEGFKWEPPKDLVDFIAKARQDGKKLVYVGFGSIIVPDPVKMTQEVIEAVTKADVRCILSKGWSDRLSKEKATTSSGTTTPTNETKEPQLPPEIHVIKSVPHDWLFSQIDAAAHHGGSGTTGASLRAGVPTIIRPFFGDQYFFASRVEDIGVGVFIKKWGAMSFARALWKATHDGRMIAKARVLGESIRRENGVRTAINNIYRDLEYAKSLIRRKIVKDGSEGSVTAEDEEHEESWTFVGADEPDPEATTIRLSKGLVPTLKGGGIQRPREQQLVAVVAQ